MNAPLQPVEQLLASLPDLDWITDGHRVARLSQDFSWFSPVLKRQLEGKAGQLVARPRSEDEIRRLVAACAKLRLPITIRGTGTGNYGQCVPLRGGVVLDMSGYNGFLWARNGVARAQAGIRLNELEKYTRTACGMEMRCVPSTFRSATLGGLYGGGFGGIGSVNHGPLASRGNVLGARVMTIEEEPQVLELRGTDALALHHLWGTNGLVLELEVALAPALAWQENIVCFASLDDALEFANAIAQGPGIGKREVAFQSAQVTPYLTPLAEFLPEGQHAVFLLLDPSSDTAMRELATHWHGQVTYHRTADEVAGGRHTLAEFTWNHTTLVAFKSAKDITYLQCAFTPGKHLDQVRHMETLLGGEVLMHAEFIRLTDGQLTCTALPIVKYTSDERLREIIALYRANDVRINDPHVFIVEDGKAGGDLPAAAIEAKKRFDPLGLLNPGKVRAWMDGAPA